MSMLLRDLRYIPELKQVHDQINNLRHEIRYLKYEKRKAELELRNNQKVEYESEDFDYEGKIDNLNRIVEFCDHKIYSYHKEISQLKKRRLQLMRYVQ
ncbi:hypothetical protein H4219_005930 [Mycoemilia scoparia]|uniref:Uncharacterized protein n=1 Tax=Mycoemilia scoparia TaxID=417184 RepID=A0A9W8DND5_9FUNG|nr:hypothetical protein H4219_005930 [Mycoemilia scoparia]